ncbi:MAG: hypothetical protein LKF87_14615 [Clostridium tyrobutyricum]|uniref:hypothetical protein n=1 Tax=Clostridium tyrobutyricum TaxID=1519 RepID=UPI00242AFBDD|nr:hypothetical protein [Clostridium tyrobutyricum]MCH4200645.1 hypothetical protein [Clostridium tyrobutyricum]MCH4237543.1 hypothetical protein [Clostridium tyrobutyricum]MCH4260146.1 hypothetical protein [Clostridium tyrobutyricum]MCI2011744.1 hypothetical protein [Clostridium tyrobutyricum]
MKTLQELTIEVEKEENFQGSIDTATLKRVALKIFESNKAKFLEYLEDEIRKKLKKNKGNDNDISIHILNEGLDRSTK